jgi:hypothetical protein
MREEEEEEEEKKNAYTMSPRCYRTTECRSNQTVVDASFMAHYNRGADIFRLYFKLLFRSPSYDTRVVFYKITVLASYNFFYPFLPSNAERLLAFEYRQIHVWGVINAKHHTEEQMLQCELINMNNSRKCKLKGGI